MAPGGRCTATSRSFPAPRRGPSARSGTMLTGGEAVRFAIPDNFPVVYSDDHPTLGPLRERGDLALHSTRHGSPEELVERMRGATAAINVRAYSKFTDDVFAAL